jgi:hypothetical protein
MYNTPKNIPTQFISAKYVNLWGLLSYPQNWSKQFRAIIKIHFGIIFPKEVSANRRKHENGHNDQTNHGSAVRN